MSSDARYLSEPRKARELAQWRQLLADRSLAGGVGDPDPEIIQWCERINALPEVCTLQSCAGHERNGVRDSGHLWLWFSPRKALAFWQRAFELARSTEIERISTIYQPWGQEVVLIEFRGAPDGQLESSGQKILAFLSSL